MRAGSLKLRFLAVATLSSIGALVLAGIALTSLFEQEVRDRVMRELNNDLLQLVGAIEISDTGEIKVIRALADHRFQTPYGGKYWQVIRANLNPGAPSPPLRSRSFWDSEIDIGNSHVGPDGKSIMVTGRTITISSKSGDIPLLMMVGTNVEEITSPLVKFRNRLVIYLSLIGLALIAAVWLQVYLGLRPLKVLRHQLAELRTSHAKRLVGEFPTEVEPLISEFNDVLDLRDLSMRRARHQAGDLAHGLMTPLTILSAVARDLNRRKLYKQSISIDSQVENMRRHVERSLVRARLSTGRGHDLTGLSTAVESVLATLLRLPEKKKIKWSNNIPGDALVPIENDDLVELLGNLLDNARKFARSEVQINLDRGNLVIEDDGPGVANSHLSSIRKRGQRLDESQKGFGLGLAIVEDIIDMYKLQLSFGRSVLGGLRIEIGFGNATARS